MNFTISRYTIGCGWDRFYTRAIGPCGGSHTDGSFDYSINVGPIILFVQGAPTRGLS